MKEKRKTINGDDLIWSMGTLGFEDYVEPLKLYLKLYREVFLFSPSTLYREFI
jgi:nuclear transcription Y subunit beta